MIEYKRNGQNVKERGTVATEWTPSPLDKSKNIFDVLVGFQHDETLKLTKNKRVEKLKNYNGDSLFVTMTADSIKIRI